MDGKKIIHIVHRDKFTLGYINFMKCYFNDYDQMFITFMNSSYDEAELKNDDKVILLKHHSDIKKRCTKVLLKEADKIIVTGIFCGIQNVFAKFGKSILSKTYFQFWGGDFYGYRELRITGFRSLKILAFDKRNLIKCIKHCAGIINLVDSDWTEFYKLFPYDNIKHFTAPMPGDPNKKINYDEYRRKYRNTQNNPIRILVGNSATPTNHHIEIFDTLKVFKNENIEIVSPLSYGDDDYKQFVIAEGKKILGDKFIPIETFMDKEKYIDLLNSCDIAIFNNDRQQAMGNISIMLSLGKKVYARSNTTMWKHYSSFGINLYDIVAISSCSYEEFVHQDSEVNLNNIDCVNKLLNEDYSVKLWETIFNNE